MPKRNIRVVTFEMPISQLQKLQAIAKASGSVNRVSVSWMIRDALNKTYLKPTGEYLPTVAAPSGVVTEGIKE